MAKAYLRLQLLIDKNTVTPSGTEVFRYAREFLNHWSYRLVVKTKPNGSIPFSKPFEYEFKGAFDALLQSEEHSMESHQYSIADMNHSFEITWILSYKGKERYRKRGAFFAYSRQSGAPHKSGTAGKIESTQFSINFTHSMTEFRQDKINLQVQRLSNGTGWYLVKQPEAFQSLMNRIFINPSKIDWDIMRENNKHLGNVQMMTVLQPGQVVIIALERNNPKVKQMMADALKAQQSWKQAQMFGPVSSGELMLVDLLMQGGKLKPIEQKSSLDSAIGYIDAGKPFVDGSLEFKKSLFEQSRKAYDKVIKAAEPELSKVTTVGGMTKRGASAAGQNASRAYKLIDGSTLAQKLIAWDTGIQGDSVRSFIREEARVRHAQFQKGIANFAQNLDEVAKYSTWLKRGGYVGMVVETGVSAKKMYDAYEKGDTKKVIEEGGQLLGSLGGGAAGGAVASATAGVALAVFGIGTGGVGLVVVGLFVAGSAYAGGEGGKAFAKWGTDKINNEIGE